MRLLSLTAAVAALLFLLTLTASSLPTYAAAATTRAPAATCANKTEVYYLPDGQDYRGHVNVTAFGQTCQKWSVQYPNAHDIPLDPATGVGDHNYCRNANGLARPGCYTTQPGVGYQFCDVGPVCTASPLAKATVQFSPVGGSTLAQDGSHNYVSLSCFPRPCNIHYEFGAEALASASSPLYAGPLLLTSSTTVKAYAVFGAAASPMRVQAQYKLIPTTTAAPPSPIQFLPTDAVVYNQPILVELQGVSASDYVLLYWNDDIMNPTTYSGPFYLRQSTKIFAMVNNTYPVSASYTLNITVPPLYVYPESGRYVGGVSVLVRDPQPPSDYYMFVNGSAEREPLSGLLFPWTQVGTSVLDVRALHVHNLESTETRTYEIVAAVPPVLSPSPSVPHHRPVNLTCVSPVGTPLLLSVYQHANMQQPIAEDVYSLVLRTPGNVTVTCSYVDDLLATHTTVSTVQMVAVPMQPPTFTPDCNASFPAIPLSLQTKLDVSRLLPGAEATSWSVYGNASGGAQIPLITRSPDQDGVFIYDVFPGPLTSATSPTQPTKLRVSMTAHSQDPLEADSPAATCTYNLYPPGVSNTPYFTARPSCATTTAPVSTACIATVQQNLASCLHFYSTELLSMSPVGPYVLMRMMNIAEAIRPDMYIHMGWCLAALAAQGFLTDLHNETSGAITMATAWHVATPIRKAPQVFTNLPLTAHIEGFHATAGAYRLVRSEYTCEDVGVVPEAMLPGSPYAGYAPGNDGSTYVTFKVRVPGLYKLCAYVGDSLYTVPFSASLSGVLSEAWAPSIDTFLSVVVQPWPAVQTVQADECGGLVLPAMERTRLSVTLQALPAGAFSALSYSVGSAGWASAALPVDPATNMTGAVSLSISGLNAATRPVSVLDMSLGPTIGAAKTCVFFVSAAAGGSAASTNITYFFYTVNSTAVPAGSIGVMLMLQGTFQPDELIVVDVYDVTSPSLQLIRRITAHASAATGYTMALPDAVLGLTASADPTPLVIHATLDGVQVTAPPSTIALSPLSLAMTACSNCTSGLCYEGACLCKGKTTKAMHVCTPDDADSSSGSNSGGSSGTGAASSSSPDSGNTDSDAKASSIGERVIFLLAYLGLLGAIAAYIFVSIRRVAARHEHAQAAHVITVEPA